MGPIMRILLIAGLILTVGAVCFAERVSYTNAGYPACFARGDLDDVLGFGNAIVQENLSRKLEGNQCIILDPNLPVFVLELSWSTALIRPVGTEVDLWTVREAVYSVD